VISAFGVLVKGAALALMTALVLGWLQALHPAFDSFSTFRMVFGAALIATMLVLALLGFKRWVAAACLVLLMSTILMVPQLPGMKRGYAVASFVADKPRLKVVQANILFSLRDQTATLDILKEAAADVILLQEVSAANEFVLDELKVQYPHQHNCRGERFHSVAIVSKLPFVEGFEMTCPEPGGLAIAQVMLGERPINVVSYHAWWPWPKSQAYQSVVLSNQLLKLTGPTIFAGDFNASPWGNAVRQLALASGTRVPAGLVMTWKPGPLVGLPINMPMLSLDHMLTSDHFGLLKRTVLPSTGSDHYPVLGEYVLLD
jgi:endonuclease/exonuclease/phosphatase (EEP) superfamily protein YafD